LKTEDLVHFTTGVRKNPGQVRIFLNIASVKKRIEFFAKYKIIKTCGHESQKYNLLTFLKQILISSLLRDTPQDAITILDIFIIIKKIKILIN
jgi:hypothetical protein